MEKYNRGFWKVLIPVLLVLIFITGFIWWYRRDSTSLNKTEATYWYEKHWAIAHAMGGIDGLDYTNSLDAFYENYEKGYRVFEVDLLETADGVLIGRHKWEDEKFESYKKEEIPTAEEFLNSKILGTYTPVSFESILLLAKEYPDVYFITDSKKTKPKDNERIMGNMALTAENQDLMEVLQQQFIIQIYNEKMYDIVEKWIAPENIIYTFYKIEEEEFDQAMDFCVEKNIPVVTIGKARWNKKLQRKMKRRGLVSAVHTIDKKEAADDFLKKGVTCIYTNFLELEEFDEK